MDTDQKPPVTGDSFADAVAAFDHWRLNRTHQHTTPVDLRLQAIALLKEHAPTQVARALGIHTSSLKNWVNNSSTNCVKKPKPSPRSQQSISASDFVELPLSAVAAPSALTAHSSAPELVIDLPNGTRLSAHSVACVDQLLTRLQQAKALL